MALLLPSCQALSQAQRRMPEHWTNEDHLSPPMIVVAPVALGTREKGVPEKEICLYLLPSGQDQVMLDYVQAESSARGKFPIQARCKFWVS